MWIYIQNNILPSVIPENWAVFASQKKCWNARSESCNVASPDKGWPRNKPTYAMHITIGLQIQLDQWKWKSIYKWNSNSGIEPFLYNGSKWLLYDTPICITSKSCCFSAVSLLREIYNESTNQVIADQLKMCCQNFPQTSASQSKLLLKW